MYCSISISIVLIIPSPLAYLALARAFSCCWVDILAMDETSTLTLLNKRRENNRRLCDLGTYGGHRIEIYLKRRRYVLMWARQKIYLPKGFDLPSK